MGARLLLADDSITIQKVVGIIFANEDYDLTVVGNGIAALDKAKEAIPDLMLVDALMPGRNGYEVCQEVRGDLRLKNVPLLLMTGAFEPFDEEKAGQCGADDFISKPFESQQLLDKVKKLLELGSERAAASAAEAPPASSSQPEPLLVAGDWADSFASIPAPFEPIPDMFDDTLQATEAASPADLSSAAGLTGMAVDVVEAEPGDDPWGVFDLTDLDEQPPPVLTIEPVEPVEPFENIIDQFDTTFEPLAEETYTYQAEEPTPAGETFTIGMGEPLAVLTDNPSQYEEIVSEPYKAMFEPEIIELPPVPAPQPTFGEEQLRVILSSLSREVIEKIVWEVVPDLAETIIREEIRKLKEGIVR